MTLLATMMVSTAMETTALVATTTHLAVTINMVLPIRRRTDVSTETIMTIDIT